MITKIEGNYVTIVSQYRSGIWLLADFSDEELREQKYILLGKLYGPITAKAISDTFGVVEKLNEELANRQNSRWCATTTG